jgi:hypothetical protein
VSETRSFFTRIADDGDALMPTTWAGSRWGPDALNGPAVCAFVARALELEFADPDFTPARITVDLFKTARTRPTTAVTRLVRSGRRIRVADAEVQQDGVTVARATLVLLRKASPPPGDEWVPTATFSPPPDAPVEWGPGHPWVHSDAAGWTRRIADHQDNTRKRTWATSMPVLPDGHDSPFVRAVQAAEATSLLTNLGTEGIGYINCDLTVALSRIPDGPQIGLEADSHITSEGIAVGTATLYDRAGPFGTGIVTAVSNAAAQIDFSHD